MSTIEAPPRSVRTMRLVTGLVAGVAAVVVLLSLVRVTTTVTGRALFAFDGTAGGLSLESLPQLNRAILATGESGDLTDLALSARILSALPSLIEAVTVTLAAVFLVRAIRDIATGNPFSRRMISSWKRLTGILLIGGIIQAIVETIANVYIASHIGLGFGFPTAQPKDREDFLGANYSDIIIAVPHWPIALIVGGLVAWSLLTAFRMGAKFERAADGVV